MDNIQFTFKHDLNTNFLHIDGIKTFNNKNYACSVYGKIDKIDLQEVLRRIETSIQDKIIEDLTKNKVINVITNLTNENLISKVIAEKISSEIMITGSEINIKFEER